MEKKVSQLPIDKNLTIDENFTKKLALLNKREVQSIGQRLVGNTERVMCMYPKNRENRVIQIAPKEQSNLSTIFEKPNTGIQIQQLNNVTQPNNVVQQKPVRRRHPVVTRRKLSRNKLLGGMKPKQYAKVSYNKKKTGDKPSIAKVRITKKPVKPVEVQKDNIPMVAQEFEKGLTVQPKNQKNLTVAQNVEKGLTVRQEKKNSLMVRPKDQKSLTVAEKVEKGLTVQTKEVTRGKRNKKPYGLPLLLTQFVQQGKQVQSTDSNKKEGGQEQATKKNGADDGGMSQVVLPCDNADESGENKPANDQNKEMAPKKALSEDNKQGVTPPTTTNNKDKSDAYNPNNPQAGRVYQSDVNDNSPEGQNAGGLGGTNSDVPGKPSQKSRLPFGWLWLLLGSIAEALQYRRRRKFLIG